VGETLAVRGRSSGGHSRKVAEARKRARAALGRDDTPELFDVKPQTKAATPYIELQVPRQEGLSEAVGVLTLGEAAARLGVSRPQLEAMIAAGKIEVLPTGFTRTIPTREVERLSQSL
jgi:excisionase family DNA binding protein